MKHHLKASLYSLSVSKPSTPPLPVFNSLNILLNILSNDIPKLDKATKNAFAEELATIITEPWSAKSIIEEIFNALRELPPEID